MSEHPDWKQFKAEMEHQDYLADLAIELDEEENGKEGVDG